MAFQSIGVPNSPTLEVSFDYTNDPTSRTHTWTDITPYVVSYSRDPVRSNEFDQPGPAGATITLRNDDGRFSPDNASGPYYGGLKKYRRLRVRAQWNSVTYNRYWGFVLDWPQTWVDGGKDQTVTIRLVDALTPPQTYDLQGQAFSSEPSGTAISDVLTAAGAWGSGAPPIGPPGPAWNLDVGISTIVSSGTLGVGSFAAQRLKDIGASEMGVTFADGGGTIQFHDRHHRLTQTRSIVVQATVGDTSGAVRYVDPNPQYGDVWPIVQATPSGGSVVSTTVDAGTAAYFQQTLTYPTGGQYLVSDAAEALAATQYLANRYSTPDTRVDSVTAVGMRDAGEMWPTLLGLDTSDLVLFQRRFLVNGVVGGTITLNQIVEGYGDRVTVGKDWRVVLAMSPADTQRYWLAGDSVLSDAGITTIGGY